MNKGYKSTYPLFRDLTANEVQQFRESAQKLLSVDIEDLEIIHPVCRIELINLIAESLKKQNIEV